MKKLTTLALITTFSILTACGGGSGDSETPPTRTLGDGDRSYAEELAIAAGEGSKSLAGSESGGFLPLGFVSTENAIIDGLKQSLQQSFELNSTDSLLPLGIQETITETENGGCGGSMETTSTTTTPDDTSSGNIYPLHYEGTSTFIDYCNEDDGFETIFNGSLAWAYSITDPSSFSWVWDYNVSYSTNSPYGPQTGRFVYKESCSTINGVETCSTNSEPYVASTGTSYTFENATVSGNSFSGYNIEGNLIDNQGNSFSVSVQGFTQCDSGNVSTGTITITSSAGETVSVSFPNCNECVISYAGDSWTIPQP
ncbi:MAG: hypothetical protein JKY01_08930 [Pseudomonadales bacterium]|nr:hypothetical protein [Pseudomonadales bacterium]